MKNFLGNYKNEKTKICLNFKNYQNQKMLKFKKLSKSENLFNFNTIARLSFLIPNYNVVAT